MPELVKRILLCSRGLKTKWGIHFFNFLLIFLNLQIFVDSSGIYYGVSAFILMIKAFQDLVQHVLFLKNLVSHHRGQIRVIKLIGIRRQGCIFFKILNSIKKKFSHFMQVFNYDLLLTQILSNFLIRHDLRLILLLLTTIVRACKKSKDRE